MAQHSVIRRFGNAESLNVHITNPDDLSFGDVTLEAGDINIDPNMKVADGEDVAQGATTDTSVDPTVIGRLALANERLLDVIDAIEAQEYPTEVPDGAYIALGQRSDTRFSASALGRLASVVYEIQQLTSTIQSQTASTVANGANVALGSTTDGASAQTALGRLAGIRNDLASVLSAVQNSTASTVANGANVALGSTGDIRTDASLLGRTAAVVYELQRVHTLLSTTRPVEVISGSLNATITNPVTSVAVSNLPTTQQVSGTVTVANPVTSVNISNSLLNIAGSVTVGNQVHVIVDNADDFPSGGGGAGGEVEIINPSLDVNVLNPVTEVEITALPNVTIANPVTSVAVTSLPNVTIANPQSSVTIANPSLPVMVDNDEIVVRVINPEEFPSGTGGSGGSVTIADGGNVALGSTSDTTTAGTLLGRVSRVVDRLDTVNDNLNSTLDVSILASTALTTTVSNFPSTQTVAGSVSIANFPGTQTVSGSVSISNFPATQTITGTVNIGTLPDVTIANSSIAITSTVIGATSDTASQNTLLGRLTKILEAVQATQARTVTGSVSVTNLPSSQTVNGSVSITGTPSVNVQNFPATQAVSGTVTISNPVTSVTVSNTPGVTLSDGANVALGSLSDTSAQNTLLGRLSQVRSKLVDIETTINDGIAVTGSVSITGSPTVTVSNPQTSVTVSNPVLTVHVDNPNDFPSGSGGSGASTIANGADVALGNTSDTSASNTLLGRVSLVKERVDAVVTALGGSLSVAVSNFPATQAVSGTIAVNNFPATQAVSGTVSISGTPNVNISNSSIAVTGTVAVSGTPNVNFTNSTIGVTHTGLTTIGAAADASGATTLMGQLKALNAAMTASQPRTVTVSGTPTVTVNNFPTTQQVAFASTPTVTVGNASIAVTGTFWQSTQPVSHTGLTALGSTGDTSATSSVVGVLKAINASIAASQPRTVTGSVSVTNLPATQAVSGSVSISGTAAVAVSNFPVTQAVSGSVSISNFPGTQAVSGTVGVSGTVSVTNATPAGPKNTPGLYVALGGANNVSSFSIPSGAKSVSLWFENSTSDTTKKAGRVLFASSTPSNPTDTSTNMGYQDDSAWVYDVPSGVTTLYLASNTANAVVRGVWMIA